MLGTDTLDAERVLVAKNVVYEVETTRTSSNASDNRRRRYRKKALAAQFDLQNQDNFDQIKFQDEQENRLDDGGKMTGFKLRQNSRRF